MSTCCSYKITLALNDNFFWKKKIETQKYVCNFNYFFTKYLMAWRPDKRNERNSERDEKNCAIKKGKH